MITTSRPARIDDAVVATHRTYRSSPTRAWQLLVSAAGAAAWLGETPHPWWHEAEQPESGTVVETPSGERFEVVALDDGTSMCLHTLGPRLVAGTSISLTMTPERGRTVVVLRQDRLPTAELEEPMREHWSRALERIGELLDAPDER